MPDLVPVRVRDCACPDTPHADDGDIVWLAPKVSLDLGIAAQQAILASRELPPDRRGGYVTREWMKAYIRFAVVGSNFLDPLDPEALIADFELAGPVAEAANDLYAETLLRPLGMSPSTSSPGGRTGGSTSRTKRSRTPSPA